MIKSTLSVFFALSFIGVSAQQVILKSESTPMGGSMNTVTPEVAKPAENTLKPFEPKQFESLGQGVIELDHDVVYVGKAAPSGVNIYHLPLFGGYHKSIQQIEDDEAFLADCDKNFDTREKGSLFFSDMGWQYLSEGSKEMATYRFNLAHLLNQKNIDVYWGLGVIEYQQGHYEEAIKLMTQGIETDEKFNVTLMVDLATVHIKCFTENQHPSDLKRAFKILDDAKLLAPNFANTYMQLALANLVNGEIDQAWLQFHKGYKIDPNAVDTQILTQLLNQKPDPQGVFE
ncbi:tetratricopeptide repeat protein [Jiulongibacter sediminis]|uniref:tetratricopeptide repeat protein n=1 Tax=Jiulongibacter sediminis TaxID=1605367 RepID=UPI0006DC4E33|nr:tetratricopeptide repeat protein [Jiulongibacter sediminis]